MFDFITFGIKDFIDIAVVVFLVFQAYRLVRGTVAVNIFVGMIVLFLLWKLVEALQMTLLSGILGQFMSIGVLAVVILFQQEIRRFLILIGTNNFFVKHFFSKIKRRRAIPEKIEVKEIVNACFEMAKTRTGALIVIKKSMFDLKEATTGDVQNIVPTQSILESIFYKNSPLHDGAMIISHKRIKAAGCILPVSHNLEIPKELGLRHRAALGVSQETDAMAIIVSEETGGISIAYHGQFHLKLTAEELERMLTADNRM